MISKATSKLTFCNFKKENVQSENPGVCQGEVFLDEDGLQNVNLINCRETHLIWTRRKQNAMEINCKTAVLILTDLQKVCLGFLQLNNFFVKLDLETKMTSYFLFHIHESQYLPIICNSSSYYRPEGTTSDWST